MPVVDYHTECTEAPESLMELLARCIVLNNGHYYLNIVHVAADCNLLHDFWTCSNGHLDPERALAENIFAIDECGHLAVKVFSSGEYDGRRYNGQQ